MSFQQGNTFVYGEQPSASKFDQLWRNDDALQDWSAFDDDTFPVSLYDSNADSLGFVEIGRTTLGSTTSAIDVSSLPAKKYLRLFIFGIPTGGTGGAALQFNGDTSTNYAQRTHFDGTSASNSTAANGGTGAGLFSNPFIMIVDVLNIANQEKLCSYQLAIRAAAGNNVPSAGYGTFKWINTASQINRVTLPDIGTGDWAAGSEIVVLGHD